MDTRSTTTTAAAAAPPPATGDASLVVRIKKEPTSSSDEMKEFAETAMNELLGWYGYDGGGEDEDGADESDVQLRTRSIGDSSGPECSDSGGGGGGGGSEPGGPWCGWCSRPMTDSAQATGAFCSELCFSQSRRASFKRNRTCDWCRHVRHTVAHVDVRDGARHLQFCGDKCLNQYKMHIFCRETRAHLELHPHPHPAAHPSASGIIGDAALITPDLWLRDCKDESSSDRQASSMSPRHPQPASHESLLDRRIDEHGLLP
ncbi:Sine oculis-binding protein [Carabus blaptoides fortunei]